MMHRVLREAKEIIIDETLKGTFREIRVYCNTWIKSIMIKGGVIGIKNNELYTHTLEGLFDRADNTTKNREEFSFFYEHPDGALDAIKIIDRALRKQTRERKAEREAQQDS